MPSKLNLTHSGFKQSVLSTSEGHGSDIKKVQNSSYLWKNLALIWPEVTQGSKWALGNGQVARFWADNWIGELGPLKNLATIPIPELELHRPVCDLVDAHGTWKRNVYEPWLPSEVADLVTQSTPPRPSAEPDSQYWERSSTGCFTVASPYKQLQQDNASHPDPKWDLAWKWPGVQRICSFLWLALNDRLLTNKERRRRHMTETSLCSVC